MTRKELAKIALEENLIEKIERQGHIIINLKDDIDTLVTIRRHHLKVIERLRKQLAE